MLDKLTAHPSLNYQEDLKTICKPLELFNISTFANARVNDNGEFSTINNHPDYMIHYLEQRYHSADISAKEAALNGGNYLMWDLAKCHGKTAEMLNAAAEFSYKHIFTIIKHRQNYTDYYHFGTHRDDALLNQWYLNNIDKLELFIDYFDDKISSAKQLASGHDIVFPAVKTKEFQMDVDSAISESDALFVQQLLSQRLSIRQQECVKLLIQGYTVKQIAKSLNLSFRTVEDYINVMKKKFQVTNKTALLGKVMVLKNML